MTPETSLLLFALAALSGCVILPIIAYLMGCRHGGVSSNQALRECQAQMMRGAAVLHHKRPDPHKWADPELEVVKTEQGGLAFTDGEWSKARARYDAIVPELNCK